MRQTVFEVIYDFKDRASRQFKSASDRIGTAADRSAARVKRSTNAMNMLGRAVKAFIALAAIRMFTRWKGESIRLAAEQEAAIMKLRTALVLTGRATDSTVPSLVRYANHLQNITTVGNETSLKVMGTLASLTKLNEDGIKEATRVSIGLSKALGMDLNAAALQVAKTIESDTNALVRYGVQVDMTADSTGRLAQLVDKTSHMFQIAVAETNTYTGAVAQLNNAYGDWRKQIAGAISQSGAVREFLKGLTRMFSDATDSMAGDTESLEDCIRDVAINLTHLAETLMQVFDSVQFVIKSTERAILSAVTTWQQRLPDWMPRTMQIPGGGFIQVAPMVYDETISKGIGEIDKELRELSKTILRRDDFWRDVRENMRNAEDSVTSLGSATKKANDAVKGTGEAAKSAAIGLDDYVFAIKRVANAISSIIQPAFRDWRVGELRRLRGVSLEAGTDWHMDWLFGLGGVKPRPKTPYEQAEDAGERAHQYYQAQTGQTIGTGLSALQDIGRFHWRQLTQRDGGDDLNRRQAIEAAFKSPDFIGQAIGSVGQGAISGGGRGAIAAALPLVGGVLFGAIGAAVGGLLGGLFGRQRRGEIAASPVYVQDVRSSDLLTELLNITKAGLAGASAGRINDISASLATQALRTS